MFPRPQRLTGAGAGEVGKRGRNLSSGTIRLKWMPARGKISRATVVVPLSFARQAVRRNRIKRQIREILRPLLPLLRPPVNAMIFIGKGAAGKTFQELREEVVRLLRKSRLF